MMRLAALLSSLGLLFGAATLSFEAAPAAKAVTAPNAGGATVVKTAMKNVDYRLTDRIIVHIATLNGKLTPKQGDIPVFDDKNSFVLDMDSANITISPATLSNDLNDFVFAKPDASLKKLSATIQGGELTVKGLLVSKGGIPFETSGTLSVTPAGMIRVHTTKVKALKLPVKGLMDMLGLDTQKILDTQKSTGVSVDKDDLILNPETILPPPQLSGHLTSIKIENGSIVLTFGPDTHAGKTAPIKEGCGARNYLLFKGGSVRFGKMTMADTDLELLDADPVDPFDFAIDHYNEQLVAGYPKSTKEGGLCVHMPDYNKIKQTGTAKK
jgi:hypothetical protein